jgi:hypothetical protein
MQVNSISSLLNRAKLDIFACCDCRDTKFVSSCASAQQLHFPSRVRATSGSPVCFVFSKNLLHQSASNAKHDNKASCLGTIVPKRAIVVVEPRPNSRRTTWSQPWLKMRQVPTCVADNPKDRMYVRLPDTRGHCFYFSVWRKTRRISRSEFLAPIAGYGDRHSRHIRAPFMHMYIFCHVYQYKWKKGSFLFSFARAFTVMISTFKHAICNPRQAQK